MTLSLLMTVLVNGDKKTRSSHREIESPKFRSFASALVRAFVTHHFFLASLFSPSPPMTHHSLSEELHAIAAALVGGARYGFKIRLPHAMVMIWLFRRDLTSKQKMSTVARMVREHSINLAAFAALYKVT